MSPMSAAMTSLCHLNRERTIALSDDLSILDPRAVSPLHRARTKRKMRLQQTFSGVGGRPESEPVTRPTHLLALSIFCVKAKTYLFVIVFI